MLQTEREGGREEDNTRDAIHAVFVFFFLFCVLRLVRWAIPLTGVKRGLGGRVVHGPGRASTIVF